MPVKSITRRMTMAQHDASSAARVLGSRTSERKREACLKSLKLAREKHRMILEAGRKALKESGEL